MKRLGYTPLEAGRVKARIERSVARIEDEMATIRRAVPDVSFGGAFTGPYPENVLEEVREIRRALFAIVDRRTQSTEEGT